MLNHLVIRSDPDHFCVEIPLRRNQITKTIDALKLLGIPAVRPPGGAGWLLDEGCMSISGTQSAVEKALDEIEYVLHGPKFETGLDIAARHQKGALP